MDSEKKIESRKNFFVNPAFQLKFCFFLLTVALMSNAVIYLAELYFFSKARNLGTKLHFGPNHLFYTLIRNQESMMQTAFFINAGIVFVLVFTVGLLYSHKITGPLHQFTQHLLKSAETGHFSKISFRKKDFFNELTAAYNDHLPQQQKPNEIKKVS